MDHLPSAIVDSSRHRRTRLIRRIAAATIISVVCFAGWKLLSRTLRSEANKQLERRQDLARARIGDGLDELFEQQLDRDSQLVGVDASFAIDGTLGGGLTTDQCLRGLDAAFEEALGKDVVTFSTSGASRSAQMVLAGTITPSGHVFQLPHSSTEYPGIALAADITFLGKTIHADVKPGASVEFTYETLRSSLLDWESKPLSDQEVAGGILQGTCRQVGYSLLETLTTWKRPAPPPLADPVAECQRGFHCRENAEALEDRDPEKAAELFDLACLDRDSAACTRVADLAARLFETEGRRVPGTLLGLACNQDVPAACTAAARMELLYEKPSTAQVRGALALFLRACDLGARDACQATASILPRTPLAEAVPLMSGARSARSKTLGTIFALRWGQWTTYDRGQPTAWVTARPPRPPKGALVTPFEVSQLPPGILAPPGATTVYAVALEASGGERCERCNPSGPGRPPYSFRSTDCVCAILR